MVGFFLFFLISSNSDITQQGSNGRANISSRKMSNYTCLWHQISEKWITDNKDLSDLVQKYLHADEIQILLLLACII